MIFCSTFLFFFNIDASLTCNKRRFDKDFWRVSARAHSSSGWKEKLSAWAGGEDCEPDALGPEASRVEVLPAPCDFSPWWSLWNGLPAAESRREHNIIFPTWRATLRTNRKKDAHLNHISPDCFNAQSPRWKLNWVHGSWIVRCFRYIKIKLWGNPPLIV